MKIALVTRGLPFSGDTLEKRSLGGSETAMIYMAKSLAKLGCQVDVFCDCDNPGEFDGVRYHHVDTFSAIATLMTWDVLIVSRAADYLRFPTNVGLRVLWCHDVLTNGSAVANCLFQTDLVMLLSDYHIKNYTEGPGDNLAPFKDFIWKTSNGIDMDLVQENLRPKEPKKLIYTSRPERGLLHLLKDIFPKVLEKHPDAKLYYANYSLDKFPVGDEVRQIAEACDVLAKRLGDSVVPLGHLTKAELYQQISSSELMVYSTPFPEISCISMMEAAACGTPVVTTRDFALTETVKDGRTGVLVAGNPQDPQYTQRFVSVVDYLLSNDKKRQNMAKEGPKWVRERGYVWEKVAQTWLKKFQDLFDTRWKEHGDAILLEMERHSDILPAIQIGKTHGLDVTRLEAAVETLTLERPRSYEEVQRIVRRWEKVVKVTKERNIDLSSVLDLHCGDAAFGLHLLKVNPKAHVTFADANQDIRESIRAALEKAELLERATIIDPTEVTGTFSLVFCNDKIDMHPSPQQFAEELGTLVTEGGNLILTSRIGAQHATVGHDPRTQFRVWNFSAADYLEMFSASGTGSGLNLVEEGVGVGGDPIGHWIVVLQKDHLKDIRELDLTHRTRLYRPYVRLGVAMIARDAEDWIVKCLKHLRPIADDIHIAVDDRTKDSTTSLALEHGADKVWPVKFEDFSQIRNESIKDLQQHDWIFWVDTDEMLIDGAKLRRYLRGPCFAGYGVRQQHLMIDVHGTYDMPIRLFRPAPHHKFVGAIHEHCVDTKTDPYGNESISPSILIPDVDLAHYGYPNEQSRRAKCSNRNMELLLKDVKTNGVNGRMLSWVLVMRDYMNIAKWRINPMQPRIRKQSIEAALLEAAIRVHLKYFSDPSHKYHGLTFGMYQEALSLLGSSGVPFEGRPTPPFETAIALGGSLGGMQNKQPKPESMWFLDMQQFIDHMNRLTVLAGAQMGVCNPVAAQELLTKAPKVEFKWNDHDLDLLLLGLNNIDTTTGRLMRA